MAVSVKLKVTDQRRRAHLGLGEGVGPDAVPSGRRAAALINLSNSNTAGQKNSPSTLRGVYRRIYSNTWEKTKRWRTFLNAI